MTIRYVPSVYATIQDALNVAVSGDVLELDHTVTHLMTATGHWVWCDTHAGGDLTIRSDDAYEKATVDCQSLGGLFTHGSLRPGNLTFRNLIVQNGLTANGGAVAAAPTGTTTFENVLFDSCSATNRAGAIDLVNAGPIILRNVIFYSCIAVGYSGGGCKLWGASISVLNCAWLNCQSQGSWAGGADFQSSSLNIENALFDNCYALGSYGSGGGAFLIDYCGTVSANFLTVMRCSVGAGAEGGGVDSYSDGSNPNKPTHITIKNSIFWNNTSTLGRDIANGLFNSGEWIHLENCQRSADPGSIYGTVSETATIQGDPLFVAANDCHLSQIASGQLVDSPSVDSGDAAVSTYPNEATRSTRTDLTPDTGIADRGYHFPAYTPLQGLGQTELGSFGKLAESLRGLGQTELGSFGKLAKSLRGLGQAEIDAHGTIAAEDPLAGIGQAEIGGYGQLAESLAGIGHAEIEAHGTPEAEEPLAGIGQAQIGTAADLQTFSNKKFNTVKLRSCENCDHYQPYGVQNVGECRAHPPVKCCPGMQPRENNFPQINANPALFGAWWCDEWKRKRR